MEVHWGTIQRYVDYGVYIQKQAKCVRRSNITSISVVLLALSGCTIGMERGIQQGSAQLIPDTVSVRPFGMNYRISGIVERDGSRANVSVFGSDCQEGRGDITGADESEEFYIRNAMSRGADPADRLFSTLCRLGTSTADQMEAALTDEQRQRREAGVKRAIVADFVNAAARREKQNQIDAVHDAVSDAINEQRQRALDCQPNGSGFTCRQQ